jgi:hypothetical protein
MGLGSENPRNKMYYLNLRSKRDKVVDPHFTVECKVDGNMTKMKDETEVSGQFLKIAHGEYTWESERGPKKERTIAIHLVDGQNEFKIEMNINSSLARNVMNTLCSVKVLGWVVIRVYVKDKFPKIFIQNDNESLGWAFEWKDNLEKLTEKVPDYENPGEMRTLYTKLNDYLLNAWIGQEKVLNTSAREMAQLNKEEKPANTAGGPAAAEPAPTGGGLQQEFDQAAPPAGHISDGPTDGDSGSGSDDSPF